MPLFKSTLFIVAIYSIINSYLHSILFLSLSLKVDWENDLATYTKSGGVFLGGGTGTQENVYTGRLCLEVQLLYPFNSGGSREGVRGTRGARPPSPLIFRPNWDLLDRASPLSLDDRPRYLNVFIRHCLYTIFDRKRTHFVYLPLTDGTPFTKGYIFQKNSPSFLVSGTTFRNYIIPNLKEQFLCYINLVLDLLRWAGWANSLNKAFQKIAPWLTSLELKFPLNCFECTVFYFLDFFKAIKSFC